MVLAYAVEKHLIIALDRKPKQLKVMIKNEDNQIICSCIFFDTDFTKIDLNIIKGFVRLKLDIDGDVTERKVYVG